MHTLARNAHHNERLLKYCMPKAYPDGVTIEKLVEDNIINATQVAEVAVSRLSGVPLCEVGEHRDLVDNSDIKTATVRAEKRKLPKRQGESKRAKTRYSTVYRASISNVAGKIGTLRCLVYNPFLEKYHFYVIPPSAYAHIGLKIAITYSQETFSTVGTWARFEVDTFEDMCRQLTTRDKIDFLVTNIDKKNLEATIEEICKLVVGNEASSTIYKQLQQTGS